MASAKQSGNAVEHDESDRDPSPDAAEAQRQGKGAQRHKGRTRPERREAEAGVPRKRPDAQEINVIRPGRPRRRVGEPEKPASLAGEAQPGLSSAAAQSGPNREPGAAQPSAREGRPDPWALPQSVRERFLQERRHFYFADGTEAFRDRGKRLTTASENTEVIRSLIEIAKIRGWSEIVVEGTERFRREAWQQGRAAALDVRGYRPTAPERAMLARTLTRKEITRELVRQEENRQLDLEMWHRRVGRAGEGPEPATPEVREDPPHAGSGRDRRELIVGTLVDHGRENYRFDPREEMSYFLQIKTPEGKRTLWGKDLERAMSQSLTQPQVGDEIALRRAGAEKVTVQRRERDGDGQLMSERPIEARRIRWVVEKRGFFESRAAAAEVVRDPKTDRRQAAREHPELVGTFLQLRAAELAAQRIRDPQDQQRFVALVRGALADSVARGDPLQPVRLRDRPQRVPERKPVEREAGPARA